MASLLAAVFYYFKKEKDIEKIKQQWNSPDVSGFL